MTEFPVAPTQWKNNPYEPGWAARDFLYTPDGVREFPTHPCKLTYLLSKPFIRNFRNAVDVGCRVGEYSRYLHLDFAHVFGFDPNLWPNFRFNVDLSKVTHFHCALGDRRETIRMFGGTHSPNPRVEGMAKECFVLDAFGLEDVDYIKIDVEGFEKKVLLGAQDTIERCDPLIVIEQNHVTLEGAPQFEAKAYLESIGYRQVAIDGRGWDVIMTRGS